MLGDESDKKGQPASRIDARDMLNSANCTSISTTFSVLA